MPVRHPVLSHLQSFSIKLSDQDLLVFVRVCMFAPLFHQETGEVVRSPAHLVPMKQILFHKQEVIVYDTDVVVGPDLPLSERGVRKPGDVPDITPVTLLHHAHKSASERGGLRQENLLC